MQDETQKYPYSEVYVLTGSSGSGKTTVASILESLGAHIISADALAREVVEINSQGLNELIRKYGDSVLLSNGTLNRKKLHQLIINNDKEKEEVEEILHPLIKQKAKEEFLKALQQEKRPVFYDCPLYFESKLKDQGFKKSILITANTENKVARICKRDSISKDDAIKRLKNQMDDADKIKLADYVIENNGTLEELKSKVSDLFYEITKLSN